MKSWAWSRSAEEAITLGGEPHHPNPGEWRLRWKRRWHLEPARWHWWDVVIALALLGGLLALMVRLAT